MKFEAETYITQYSPDRWINKLLELGFNFGKFEGNMFSFKQKATLSIEFKSTHQLINFVKELDKKPIKITPYKNGVFRISIGEP
jgi:hypothetical protein